MSITARSAMERIPAVAIPTWPGPRYADLIQSNLRALAGAEREAMLRAVAGAMDRYLAATPGRPAPVAEAELDGALDNVLRLLTPAAGSGQHGRAVGA